MTAQHQEEKLRVQVLSSMETPLAGAMIIGMLFIQAVTFLLCNFTHELVIFTPV